MSRLRRLSNPAPGKTSIRNSGCVSFCGVRVGQFLTSPLGYWGDCGVSIGTSSAIARGERKRIQTIATIAIFIFRSVATDD